MTDVGAAAPPSQRSFVHDSFANAPVGRRAAARLIDFAIGLVVFVAMIAAVGAAAGPSPDGTGIVIVAVVSTFVLVVIYEVVLVAWWGRTLGKQLMGLEIVRADGAGLPGLRRSMLRSLIPTVLSVVLLYPLPFLIAAVVKDHRWPHDRLAGTQVTRRSS